MIRADYNSDSCEGERLYSAYLSEIILHTNDPPALLHLHLCNLRIYF
jgi:hypothetical protein